jgi:hypothetical protein
MILPSALRAQGPDEQQAQNQDQPAATQAAGSLATVRGVVRNGATGEPLPRALVRIEGDAGTGTLTDGDGRFEIPSVPMGAQEFQVVKPGFLDETYETASAGMWETTRDYAHNVMVADQMPDLVFTMTPTNSIRGQIQLSSGDPAEAVGVVLLRRAVQDGRVVWQAGSTTKTNSEGVYRFGGLSNGVYAVYTEPAMDSDPATNLMEAGDTNNVARNGYASQFHAEAQDLAGAAKIGLTGGDEAQANLALTLEPFHAVTAKVIFPDARRNADQAPERSGMSFSAVIMDAQGHQLPYSAQYDPETRMFQAILPDGTYSLLVTVTTSRFTASLAGNNSSSAALDGAPMTGQVDFSVAGSAVSNLRIPLTAPRGNPVQVTVVRTAAQLQRGGDGSVFITLSETGGWIVDGMVSAYAQGAVPGPLETTYMAPGAYWAHTSITQRGLCEASFTAGGASLAREPLVLGLSGSTAPLSLTLRDDCASLTLALPAALAAVAPGEEPFYTVYVVPDFDSTEDVVPQTLRPSTGATVTLQGLTPGSYHVYTFDKPVALEYRNPATLPNPGQAVTLSAGAPGNLVVEAPEH